MDVDSGSVTLLPMSPIGKKRGSLTASLIEGAIAAGLGPPALAPSATPYNLLRYIRWLAGNYVFASQTPGLFRRGAERFEMFGRADLAEFARQKADEEQGHADLAYRDLQGLGLPAADVIALVEPPSAAVFVDRFRGYVESPTPVALFGFSYCLERMAACRDEAFIRRVEAICPPQARAYRFLKVHSGVGADNTHVDEQLAFFESLTGDELTAVARAAFETASMLTRQAVLDEAISDDEVKRRLNAKGISFPSLPGRQPAN